jgi:hypothetical protein
VGAAFLTDVALPHRTQRLGIGAAVALGLAGTFLVVTRRGTRAYLADAALEAGFAAAWLVTGRHHR